MTFAGTPLYMAPELVNNQRYTNKVDIWSLGCILYELCTFVPAFNGTELKNIMSKIVSKSLIRIPKSYTNNLQDLITRMLIRDPSLRPTAVQLLSMPIFRNCILILLFRYVTTNGIRCKW